MKRSIKIKNNNVSLKKLFKKLQKREGGKIKEPSEYSLSLIGKRRTISVYNMAVIKKYIKKGIPKGSGFKKELEQTEWFAIRLFPCSKALGKKHIKNTQNIIFSLIKSKYKKGERFYSSTIEREQKSLYYQYPNQVSLNFIQTITVLKLLEIKGKLGSEKTHDNIEVFYLK